MAKIQKFNDMTNDELHNAYNSMKSELFNLRFQQTTGQLKNPVQIRNVKKDIARVLTVLNLRAMKGGNK